MAIYSGFRLRGYGDSGIFAADKMRERDREIRRRRHRRMKRLKQRAREAAALVPKTPAKPKKRTK